MNIGLLGIGPCLCGSKLAPPLTELIFESLPGGLENL